MGLLETVDLDGFGVELKTFLANKELLEILALVALELDHLAHLTVVDGGAIASCGEDGHHVSRGNQTSNQIETRGCIRTSAFEHGTGHTKLLLDDLKDLALIKFLGQALNGGQGLTSISLCHRNG